MLPIRKLVLAALLLWPVAAHAESGVKVGVLKCHIEPSVGLIFIGREKLECRFTPQDAGLPAGRYAGAITTIGLDLGFSAGGYMAWAVWSPTAGPLAGALAGHYGGATGEVGIGVGLGANVLVGGSGRTVALQPVSVEGEVGVNLTVGISGMELRYIE